MSEHILFHVGEPVKAEPFHYTLCGLDNVYLMNGYCVEETPYGEAVSIKDADELHTAIGLNLVQHRKVLSSKEVRFLRKQLELTQAKLGDLIGQSSQQVARWEKDRCAIPGPADRLLRVLFLARQMDDAELRGLLERLNEIDAPANDERMVFEATEDGWLEAA